MNDVRGRVVGAHVPRIVRRSDSAASTQSSMKSICNIRSCGSLIIRRRTGRIRGRDRESRGLNRVKAQQLVCGVLGD